MLLPSVALLPADAARELIPWRGIKLAMTLVEYVQLGLQCQT